MYFKKIEFANFTCTFGDELVMLDLFEQIVFPSFENKNHKRLIRGSEYFFIDTDLINWTSDSGENFVAIAGKLVKNTKLKREQIYREPKGIIEDHEELETAPTSMFVLILNNHRLLYVREVSGAPDLTTFKSTCSNFFGNQHRKFIDKLYEDKKKLRIETPDLEIITKRELLEKYPYPHIRITPLADKQGLSEFINKFSRIDDLTIKLLPTNTENINNDEFWNKLGNTRMRMESKNVAVLFRNPKDGLNSEEVYEQCKSATGMANSNIKLNGFGQHGGTIKGSNDDFSLSIEFDELSKNVKIAAPNLLAAFINLVSAGAIQMPIISEKVTSKINEILNRFF